MLPFPWSWKEGLESINGRLQPLGAPILVSLDYILSHTMKASIFILAALLAVASVQGRSLLDGGKGGEGDKGWGGDHKGGWSHGNWGTWTPLVIVEGTKYDTCHPDVVKEACHTTAYVCKVWGRFWIASADRTHWYDADNKFTCSCPTEKKEIIIVPTGNSWGHDNWGHKDDNWSHKDDKWAKPDKWGSKDGEGFKFGGEKHDELFRGFGGDDHKDWSFGGSKP